MKIQTIIVYSFFLIISLSSSACQTGHNTSRDYQKSFSKKDLVHRNLQSYARKQGLWELAQARKKQRENSLSLPNPCLAIPLAPEPLQGAPQGEYGPCIPEIRIPKKALPLLCTVLLCISYANAANANQGQCLIDLPQCPTLPTVASTVNQIAADFNRCASRAKDTEHRHICRNNAITASAHVARELMAGDKANAKQAFMQFSEAYQTAIRDPHSALPEMQRKVIDSVYFGSLRKLYANDTALVLDFSKTAFKCLLPSFVKEHFDAESEFNKCDEKIYGFPIAEHFKRTIVDTIETKDHPCYHPPATFFEFMRELFKHGLGALIEDHVHCYQEGDEVSIWGTKFIINDGQLVELTPESF